jgi:HSP20 family protein
MALPTKPATSWMQSLDFPSQLFETGSNDYELYEQDDEFVLSVEMPGFDPEEITVTWDDGVLNISAEHEDESYNRRRTYHRRFRVPKDVADDAITASYEAGVLEVTLPVEQEAALSGKQIDIEA